MKATIITFFAIFCILGCSPEKVYDYDRETAKQEQAKADSQILSSYKNGDFKGTILDTLKKDTMPYNTAIGILAH